MAKIDQGVTVSLETGYGGSLTNLVNDGTLLVNYGTPGRLVPVTTYGSDANATPTLGVSLGFGGASGLSSTNPVTLTGTTLAITSQPGFQATAGTRYLVLSTPTTPAGQFSHVSGNDNPGGPDYVVAYDAYGVWLVVAKPTVSTLTAESSAGSPVTSSTYGQVVTLSDVVTSGGQPISSVGGVQFFEAGQSAPLSCAGSTTPVPLGANGVAQCALPAGLAVAVQPYEFTAVYSDSSIGNPQAAGTAYASTSASTPLSVIPVSTTTSLSAQSPIPFGTPVLSATVTAASGTGTLGGTVTLLETKDKGSTWTDMSDCAPSVPTPGQGATSTAGLSCTASTLGVGSYLIRADYGGDGNTQASSSCQSPYSACTALVVTGEQATVGITSTSAQLASGQSVTFTATASVNNNPPPVGGSFSFFYTPSGATVPTGINGCGDLAAAADGSRSCTTTALPVGVEEVDAVYTSDPNAPNYLSGTNGVLEQVGPTTTTLSGSPNPSMTGDSVTYTAQVASLVDSAAGAPAPGGTVTFSSVPAAGGTPVTLCSGPVNMTSAQAVCLSTITTPGTYTVTATYGGDTGNAASSGTWTQTVAALPTTTRVSSATEPSDVNAPVTFTASVLDTHGNAVNSGQVVFSALPSSGVTATSCAPVNLVRASAGQASCTLTFTQAGTYTVSASYTDASGVLAPSNGSVGQGVGVGGTTTSVTFTDNSQPNGAVGVANTGDSLTFTAMVTQTGTINSPAGGTVDFKATDQNGNTTLLCSAVPLSSGSAPCNASAPAASAYAITAAYSGDTADGPSLGWEAMTVNPSGTQNQASTSTAVTATPNPSGVGAAVTVTATVTGASPTGALTFVETPVGGNPAVMSGCPTALPNGQTSASCPFSPQAVGTYTFSVTYGGDTNNAPSSGSVGHTVSGDATTTSVTSAAASASPGSPVTFTATVGSGGQAISTGTVSFTVSPTTGTTVPASCSGATLSATGTASCSITFATAGTYTVTAAYSDPTDTYVGSAGSVGQTIGQPATATAVSSGTPASAPGAPVTFTATVTSGNSAPTSGTVTFTVTPATGATVPASCAGEALSATGSATCSITFATAGTYTVTASYTDVSGTYGSSRASVGQGVGETETVTRLASSSPSSTAGSAVTFTA
ncbi:MAG: beta strand repeat-containing protein, partial [Acidimicrobiales bacterium]